MRLLSIDLFRGLLVIQLIVISLFCSVSAEHEFLQHNLPNSIHALDFILPMFLFASGMSMVFFHEKRKDKPKLQYALDIIERFGLLVLVSILLSPFSGSGFFDMDVVMVNALLFVPTILLLTLPENWILVVSLAVYCVWIGLAQVGALPDFSSGSLGGYWAAPFYLPVMLWGALLGKRILTGTHNGQTEDTKGRADKKLLLGSVILSALLLLLAPPYKLSASPSFMALSVTLSLVCFSLINLAVKHCSSGLSENPAVQRVVQAIAYLGMNPLRSWVILFVVFLIPLGFYLYYSEGMGVGVQIGLPFWPALACSLLGLVAVYAVSLLLDRIWKRNKLVTV